MPGMLKLRSLKQFLALFLVGLGLVAAIAACSSPPASTANSAGGSSSSGVAKPDMELTLVGYAIPKLAYDVIIPRFIEKWKREHNQNINFNQSYGASGSQTRAVMDGLDADIVHLAVGSDVEKLVKAGLIQDDWEKRLPDNGVVAQTVAAIVTRAGNPKNIRSWGDLTRSDVTWVTPDPKTSGGGRWNFLGLWTYGLKTGKTEAQTQEFVTSAYRNVSLLARDAREATDAFARQGQGDALVNYENEIILATQRGEELDYIVPEMNISIDTFATVVDQNVDKHGNREVAEAFVQYLFTPEAQREFVRTGFRPYGEVAKEPEFASKFSPVKQLSTVKDVGGWTEAQKKFFDAGGVFSEIQQSLGKR